MDEDNTVKAPVTRLRRRLSAEPTEERASTPNTPTKKRATRRAKPELDLIDENAATPNPITPQKRTLRKNTKDALEPVEEKKITPARRSTRVKSNTSILSESAVTVAVDSPRARRAARRNSQLGSDNESIITPTRQTRRTRKDSTSSIDKGDTEPVVVIQISDAIQEEPETSLRKSISGERENKSPYNLRRSPQQNNKYKSNEEHSTPVKAPEVENQNKSPLVLIEPIEFSAKNGSKLSDSSLNLISNLDKENNHSKNNMNKSTSILESNNFESKKRRTKSLSKINSPTPKDTDFYSDNDRKKNKLASIKLPLLPLKKAAGDGIVNANDIAKDDVDHHNEIKNTSSILLGKHDVSITVTHIEQRQHMSSEDLFNKEPSDNSKPEIVIEDSDSNPERVTDKNSSHEDQCVPVVSVPENLNKPSPKRNNIKNTSANNLLQQVENDKNDYSVEPMDIDESIPEHIVLQESGLRESNNSKINQTEVADKNNKSRRKSSISQSLNNTENKSTLILTEIKDTSTNEISKSEASQIITNNKSMSKSAVDLDKTQNNEIDRKNVSATCLTSTPLQQKHFQKLVAPINTSIIKTNQDTVKSPLVQNTSKRSNKSNNDTSDDDDSSDEETSKEKNVLLNDEASDAGDDYESGDSQDEDERQYAKENEIIEKGVTLTSEEEMSNDTDYEKDSFVVSSDEEDNQLLEGTSDDLSMSDNELKMTSKSKKKYNERMSKQQKKASREMFAARHNLRNSKSKLEKESDDSLDSSDSDDVPVKQIKKNRMRLDSSHETSMISNDNTKKTKKAKRLSDSVCNESILKENEITMQNESLKESDPLAQIKEEPKTPKKDVNSTLDFVDAKVLNSTKNNETVINEDLIDPLHSSVQEDSSSDSDTNNIIENYDSVLNSLNIGNKNKTRDTSLNIEVAKKEKTKKAPVIDELNLTQVKSAKKSKKGSDKDINNSQTSNKDDLKQNMSLEKTNTNSKKSNANDQKMGILKDKKKPPDESSSDSIDLQLLFSEDSNSGSVNIKNNTHDDGIALKESKAKTDIRINSDMDEADGNINFFIDTKGDYDNEESEKTDAEAAIMSIDQNISSSSKKKKKKSLSQSIIQEDTVSEIGTDNQENNSSAKTPKSEKKNKKRLSQNPDVTIIEPVEEEIDQNINMSQAKTPKSGKKKKNRTSEAQGNASIGPMEVEDDQNISMSQTKTPKSDKKKKSRMSEAQGDASIVFTDKLAEEENTNTADEKTPKSNKKNKNKLSQSNIDHSQIIEDNTAVITKTPISEKKNKKNTEPEKSFTDTLADDNIIDSSMFKTPKSDKKKKKRDSESQVSSAVEEVHNAEDGNISVSKIHSEKKKHTSESQDDLVPENEEKTVDNEANMSSSKTPKKKKRHSESLADIPTDTQNEEVNTSCVKTPKSDKKKKKRHSESLTTDILTEKQSIEISDNVDVNTSTVKIANTSNSKSKAKTQVQNIEDIKENSDSDCPEEVAIQSHQPNTENDNEETKKSSSKKKKKKKNHSQSDAIQETRNGNVNQDEGSNKKRKRQHVSSDEITENTEGQHLNPFIRVKKNKKRKISHNDEELALVTEPEGVKRSKNKKRKEREDDDVGASKVRKTNTLEKLPVPRLPSSIISQLDDVPKQQIKKKQRIIATSQFVVENVRRNKPSNYLEESIYLHEDSPKKKPKSKIPKPKVLPTMATASSSSNTGYTTKFAVNVIPSETKFVAQMNNISNFKEDRLYNKNIRRLGTYEMYKKQRNIKLSKF